jgi:hypothetical protein
MIECKTAAEPSPETSYPDVWEHSRLCHALASRNDAILWDMARTAHSKDEFFNLLKNEVGFNSYKTGVPGKKMRHELTHFCAMMMLPVVTVSESKEVITQSEAVNPLISKLIPWLLEWLDYKLEIYMFNTPVRYEEVCIWTPSNMREKLDYLSARKHPTVTVAPDFDFNLPRGTPQLSFITTCVQNVANMCELPDKRAQADLRLTSRVCSAVQFHSPDRHIKDIRVMQPTFASEAIATGVHGWVKSIHQERGIGRWDVVPVGQDLVLLHLEVGESPSHTSPIPLHAHQLGLDGIRAIIEYVAAVGSGMLSPALATPTQPQYLN